MLVTVTMITSFKFKSLVYDLATQGCPRLVRLSCPRLYDLAAPELPQASSSSHQVTRACARACVYDKFKSPVYDARVCVFDKFKSPVYDARVCVFDKFKSPVQVIRL
jgi:hypothetical protein